MIWIDLDGVLVNFQKGACKALGIPYPERDIYTHGWLASKLPDIPLHKQFEIMHQNPTFWEDLEPSRTCAAMVSHLDHHHPGWGLLTSAWRRNAASYSGKYNWVRRHLGEDYLEKLVVASGNKWRLAHPNAHLTDDELPRVLQPWLDAGGKGFHWVCYTEDQVSNYAIQFARWQQDLEQFAQSHGK